MAEQNEIKLKMVNYLFSPDKVDPKGSETADRHLLTWHLNSQVQLLE
ncbi:hypothetical protein [Candidatus Thiodiazotropha endoloripes]|nr:hypothetical protein [Candidatus Thiodiazotropha endoloripes]MCG7901461.1 hypothetical protein [Candidatus Thiodiazotropha weberae]